MSDMPGGEEPEIFTKTQECLSEAELLLRHMEELLSVLSTTDPSSHRGRRKECQVDSEEKALLMEGFRLGVQQPRMSRGGRAHRPEQDGYMTTSTK